MEQHPNQSVNTSWEKSVLEKLALAGLKEQRAARRWGIFFKSLFFFYIVAIVIAGMNSSSRMTGGAKAAEPHTAIIDLAGVVAQGEVDADFVVTGLRNAFEQPNVKAIILRINSPGGSPVQAGYIYREIQRLKTLHPEIRVYAVITDVGASAAYYIAAAADEIYADPASMVGSIGAAINSFGFVGTMDLVGAERRFISAGDNKGFLDPFTPLNAEDKAHAESLLSQVHQQFIDAVKAGRGDRLKDSPEIFSGLVWTGEESLKLGLIDGLGSSSYVAREVVGVEDMIDYSPSSPLLDRLVQRLGAEIGAQLESKSSWRLSL